MINSDLILGVVQRMLFDARRVDEAIELWNEAMRKNNILLDNLHIKKEHIYKLESAPIKWRSEKAELKKALQHIAGMCGNPDPGTACRLILRKVKEEMEKLEIDNHA